LVRPILRVGNVRVGSVGVSTSAMAQISPAGFFIL
jgi:hypothetical protein